MMCKRKESDCSQVYYPGKFYDFIPKPSYDFDQAPNLKKNKIGMITSENPNLGAGVKLNGEPFFDFFTLGIKDDKKIKKSVGKRRSVVAPSCHVSLSLSLSYSNDTPVVNHSCQKQKHSDKGTDIIPVSDASLTLSLSCLNHVPDCRKQNHPDSGSNVNSVVDSSVSYSDGSRSEIPTDFGDPIPVVPLRIYHPDADVAIPPEQVEWTVRKVLTKSDCNDQHRLMIGKKLVVDHIISHLEESDRIEINSLNGLRVDVVDTDMGLQLKLTLKKWPSSNCYGLMDNWRRDFVKRRGLKAGEEVGLRWDTHHNRLLFTVLKISSLV